MVSRIAILGASGIGLTHARHYQELGAQVVAVLCSTQAKADLISEKLSQDYGISVKSFYNLEAILDEGLDGISICTPPSCHIANIQECFNKNLPVLCEKPLFWDSSLDMEEIYNNLDKIKIHPNRRLFVNTSNTVFIDAIRKAKLDPDPCERVFFEFYTNGSHKGIGIAHDLLPHGLSILIHLLGSCEISSFASNISINTYACTFNYGNCSVIFKFQELPDGPRHMRIGINDSSYTRVQVGNGSNYEVFLVNDLTKEVVTTIDPFKVYICKFLNFIESNGHTDEDDFAIGALNLGLMEKCIRLSEKNLHEGSNVINTSSKVL